MNITTTQLLNILLLLFGFNCLQLKELTDQMYVICWQRQTHVPILYLKGLLFKYVAVVKLAITKMYF